MKETKAEAAAQAARESGRIRVAIAGTGAMAHLVHYPPLAYFADVEIAGICRRNQERLTATEMILATALMRSICWTPGLSMR